MRVGLGGTLWLKIGVSLRRPTNKGVSRWFERPNPVPLDTAVHRPDESYGNPTLHVSAVTWVGFLPICHKAAGDTFKCRLRLDPEKAAQWGNKGSEVPTLFEADVKILLLLILFRGFQAPLGFFGLVGGGASIHDTHVVNIFRSLHPDYFDN